MSKKNYFQNVETLEDLKKQYRKLMMQYHPDRNPANIEESTKITKLINAEYERLFKLVKNIKKNKEGQTYTAYKETTEAPEEFINIINELMKHSNITIDLVGSWLWVGGDTQPVKDILKQLKFRYSGNKKMWYFTNDQYKKKTKTTYAYDTLKQMFGCTSYTQDDTTTKKAINKLAYK